MNKVILMGRLTRDPETRYSAGNNSLAICRYSLAVNRSYKKPGEPEADFFNIVAFGKTGEFAGKYFRKGLQVAVVGELRNNSYTDKTGQKRTSTEVIVSEQFFADSKDSSRNTAPAEFVPQYPQGREMPRPEQTFSRYEEPAASNEDFAEFGNDSGLPF